MTLGSLASITYRLLIGLARTWQIELVDDSFDDRYRWMPKPTIPPCKGRFEDTKGKLERLHWQGVKSLVTSPSKKMPPRGMILYNKIVRMIFKKS
jgi:hypothetical protein